MLQGFADGATVWAHRAVHIHNTATNAGYRPVRRGPEPVPLGTCGSTTVGTVRAACGS